MISRLEEQRTAVASINSNQDEKIQKMLDKIKLNVSSLVSLRQETTELLNTNVSNSQTDMISPISHIDVKDTAAASFHSNYDEKIREMLGKIDLNVSGLAILRQKTTEHLHTTRTAVEADIAQKMFTVRGRQQEIIDNLTSSQRSLNLLRTRHGELKIVVDANKIVLDDIVVRVNSTRFVKNNVGLIPQLTSNTNKEFTATARHKAYEAWEVFISTTGYFWNPGVAVDVGLYEQQVSIQIKLPTATRIHKKGLKARSDSERIKAWLLRANNEGGGVHTTYNPNVHTDRVEYRYICATAKYFDIPLSLASNHLYYSLLINGVDSRITNLTYFQIFSLDELIEMPISSDGSYINA